MNCHRSFKEFEERDIRFRVIVNTTTLSSQCDSIHTLS